MVFSKLLSSYRAFRSDFTLGGFERYYRTVRYLGMGAVVLTLGAYFFGTSHQSYLSTDHIARVNVGHVANPQAGWLAALDSALSNARARAIVLVIDQAVSSGSDLYEIEQAISHIRRVKSASGAPGTEQAKPVVSFVYGYALGGSYVLASQTDYIVAQRTATLGGLSISVSTFDPKPLLTRLGVDIITKGFGDLKVMPDKKDPNYTAYMQHRNGVYQSLYRWMVATVKENRSLSDENLKRVSQGEWYLGERAQQYGLCDDTGDLTLAVDKMVKAHPSLDGLSIVDYGQVVAGEDVIFYPVPALSEYIRVLNRWIFRGLAANIGEYLRAEFLRLNRYVMIM